MKNEADKGAHNMEQNLYDLMDWAGIEELVYSEASNPHAMLGPHLTESGLLIQALIPTAAQILCCAYSKEEPGGIYAACDL